MNNNSYQYYLQDFLQILLEKALEAKKEADPTLIFAYFDLINIAKKQAKVFEIDLKELGIEGFKEWEYLQKEVALEAPKKNN